MQNRPITGSGTPPSSDWPTMFSIEIGNESNGIEAGKSR